MTKVLVLVLESELHRLLLLFAGKITLPSPQFRLKVLILLQIRTSFPERGKLHLDALTEELLGVEETLET